MWFSAYLFNTRYHLDCYKENFCKWEATPTLQRGNSIDQQIEMPAYLGINLGKISKKQKHYNLKYKLKYKTIFSFI